MMGKSKKFSRGQDSGFVSDYRHAVETMAESKGFGSSGCVDINALEDLYDPRRKCISLFTEYYDRYGVPIQILSLSKMSQYERKDLELKLRSELEKIKNLQKKIASRSSDVVVPPPYSDVCSGSNGQKRPPLESLQRSMEVTALTGKKRAPPGRIGPHTKRVTEKRLESVTQTVPPNAPSAMLMKQCETLLNRLMLHQFGWVFNTPVDVVKLKIPDYLVVIKHPMDLGTVKSKLISGEYLSPLDFASDVRLTFSNAMTYNPPGNNVHIMAETLRKFFEVRWKSIEKKLPATTETLVRSRSIIDVEIETANQISPSKKKKTSVQKNITQEPAKRVMSEVEKHKLSTELEAILAELPESIIDFLKQQSCNGNQTGEDEIEIDIDILSDDTLFMLRKLLDDYLLDKQSRQGKSEHCEMELLHDSGISNSLVQPCKANYNIDEDVDIGGSDPPISSNSPLQTEKDVGGNDPPISSYSPVQIEKDVTLKDSKCRNSNSSGGESGSSSSGSSGGESDDAKVPLPASIAKDATSSGANLEQKTSDLDLNGISQVEQNALSNSVAVEADGLQEGERTPSERQASPEKLYRAALLWNRFADTILKAQEKTLLKGEKQDPEKLRLERVELERRIKEEKARLQAEAKAAEAARRKAEAEAAVEAKRKRELEREAARQALHKMEKTVDINGNSQFLEDLEMLSSAPDEHLQSFMDDVSPDHSQNGLGSFKLQGSNPLEQLGLFMKVDDEEEQDGGSPQSIVPDAVNDPEEGEID